MCMRKYIFSQRVSLATWHKRLTQCVCSFLECASVAFSYQTTRLQRQSFQILLSWAHNGNHSLKIKIKKISKIMNKKRKNKQWINSVRGAGCYKSAPWSICFMCMSKFWARAHLRVVRVRTRVWVWVYVWKRPDMIYLISDEGVMSQIEICQLWAFWSNRTQRDVTRVQTEQIQRPQPIFEKITTNMRRG